MNKKRRNEIMSVATEANEIQDVMESLKARLELVYSDEEYAYDSMPDNLKYSWRGQEAEEAVNAMERVLDHMKEIIEELNYLS